MKAWYAGPDEELYLVGPFDTPEEAVKEFLEEHKDEYEVCSVGTGEGVKIDIRVHAIDGILEDILENSIEELPEVEFTDWIPRDTTNEQFEDLRGRFSYALHSWLIKNKFKTHFTVITHQKWMDANGDRKK